MNDAVRNAVQVVREAKDNASRGLDRGSYRSFLGELLAEAEGWRMELEGLEDE